MHWIFITLQLNSNKRTQTDALYLENQIQICDQSQFCSLDGVPCLKALAKDLTNYMLMFVA
jgi:hypothetical protein